MNRLPPRPPGSFLTVRILSAAVGIMVLGITAARADIAQAEKLIAAGQWAQAEQALIPVVAADAGNFKAHLLLGRVRYKQGKLSASADSLSIARSLQPQNIPAVQLLGYVRFAQKSYSNAAALLNYAVEHGAGDALTRYRLGLAYQQAGETKQALDTFYRAAVKHPQDVPILAALARLESKQGNHARASYWFRKAVALRPDSAGLFYEMIDALMALENYLRAQSELKQHLALRPADTEGWHRLAEVYEKLGLSIEARDVYLRLQAMGDLRAPEARNLLAGHLRDGEWAAAVRLYRQFSDSPDPALHEAGALACIELGMWDEALAALHKAIAIKPTAKLRRTLAGTYQQAGRHDEAYLTYRELLKTETDEATLGAAAEAALRSGRTGAGLNLMKRLAATRPDNYEFRALVATTAERAAHDRGVALLQWYVASRLPDGDVAESRLKLAGIAMSAGYLSWARRQLHDLPWGRMSAEQLRDAAALADSLSDTETARTAAGALLHLDDAAPEQLAAAANILLAQGATDALDSLPQLREKHRKHGGLAEVCARWFLAVQDYEKAIRTCREAVALDPREPRLYATLIDCCERAGQPQLATDIITTVIGYEGFNPVAADFLRVAYERAGGPERAAAEMLALLRLHPDLPELLTSTAHALAANGDFREAAELYEKAIPNNGAAALDAAGCYIKAGLLPRARDVIALAIPETPARRQLRKLIDTMPLEPPIVEQAMALLEAAPDSVAFWIAAARLYEACDATAAGIVHCEHTVTTEDVPQALAGEAYLRCSTQDYAAAIATLGKLPAAAGADPEAMLLLAECHLAAGNLIAAGNTAESVPSLEPDVRRRAAEIAGQAAMRLGDGEAALADFARALIAGPISVAAAAGIEELCRNRAVSLFAVQRELGQAYRYAEKPAGVLALAAGIAQLPGYEKLQPWVDARRETIGRQ